MNRVDREASRVTRHTPKVVIQRDRAHLMTGEPACSNGRIAPGATTAIDAYVTCDECIDILERRAK